MRLLKKIFFKFFLLKIVFILFFYSKIIFANNANETNLPILERLPTSIFATVNNEPISIYDLIQRANLFSISAKIPINEDFTTKILPDLISGYIDEVIQIQEIKKENVLVQDDQVQNLVDGIEKENGFKKGELKNFLKENKTEISILEKQLWANLGWRQLVANKFRQKIIVQESEVEVIHNKLKTDIGKDEFNVEQIFISFENKKENDVFNTINNLYKQLIGGGDFLSIAKQFSDSYGGKIGKMGWVPESDFDDKIVNDIKKLEINNFSKPIKGENGYFIIKLLNKRIIGQETISDVSLFRIELIEKDDEVYQLLNNIGNCDELEEFAKTYGSTDSGSLGSFKYIELSNQLKSEVQKLNKNEISAPIKYDAGEFHIMICDINKAKPIIPSKFKIQDILINQKLEVLARQYMSELRTKAIIDIII